MSPNELGSLHNPDPVIVHHTDSTAPTKETSLDISTIEKECSTLLAKFSSADNWRLGFKTLTFTGVGIVFGAVGWAYQANKKNNLIMEAAKKLIEINKALEGETNTESIQKLKSARDKLVKIVNDASDLIDNRAGERSEQVSDKTAAFLEKSGALRAKVQQTKCNKSIFKVYGYASCWTGLGALICGAGYAHQGNKKIELLTKVTQNLIQIDKALTNTNLNESDRELLRKEKTRLEQLLAEETGMQIDEAPENQQNE